MGSKVGNLCEHLFEEHSPVRLKVLKEKRQDRLTDSPRAAFLIFRIVHGLIFHQLDIVAPLMFCPTWEFVSCSQGLKILAMSRLCPFLTT